MNNSLAKTHIEFHILQSFPVTCLNRDDVGAPKSAIVGGTSRARVSSQCWKRQVRLSLHELGIKVGIRTKKIAQLIADDCRTKGATEEQAAQCGTLLGESLAKDTLYFITPKEVNVFGDYAQRNNFTLPATLTKGDISTITKEVKKFKTAADGLDIALFGRMVAQAPELNISGAASFSHAISTHKVSNDIDFFTALDDLQKEPGSAHMGSLEFNSATYYRYVSLNIGQLWDNLGGEGVDKAIEAFVKALYMAVPSARQSTQSGACPWEFARVLVRRGQRIQAPFDKAVRATDGYLSPSIEALNDFVRRQEQLSGSLYGKLHDYTFGQDLSFSIDQLAAALAGVAAASGERP